MRSAGVQWKSVKKGDFLNKDKSKYTIDRKLLTWQIKFTRLDLIGEQPFL